jgi:hypothetical protein
MESIRTHNHLLHRVDYPRERGYRMEPSTLPPWMHLTITEKGDTKFLTVYSRIHLDKEVRINPDYSADFSDRDMIKDLSAEIHSRFIS